MISERLNITATAGALVSGSNGAAELAAGAPATVISSIEYDSRAVVPGALFVAVEGLASDGHRFVEQAVAAGAAAVAVSRGRLAEFSGLAGKGVAVLAVDDGRLALSALSAAFYGNPSHDMTVVGVTGTNGKTSITYMLESIFETCGMAAGVIGTVNCRWKGKSVPVRNTTPESADIQQALHVMRRDGVKAAVMEVSSHALALSRADHVSFDAALFTNLTRDHLDFHPDFEDYFRAKERLFSLLSAGAKAKRAGAVNVDDPYGRRLYEGRGAYTFPVASFAVEGEADYMPEPGSVVNATSGLSYRLALPEPLDVRLRLAGAFHVQNSLAAIAAAHLLGVPMVDIGRGLSALGGVPGRFDLVPCQLGFDVVVDYAHTSDGLEKLLRSAREITRARLITVFGCGGDRDKTKRPVMGRTASSLSDVVIVTSDNPRTEDPGEIIKDILRGIYPAACEVVPDRAEAIGRAVGMAREGDVVIIAGKGHEDYQIVGTVKRHFDDREVATEHIGRRRAG